MTANEITFSIRLPNSGPYTSSDAVREVALLADELGFEALTVHDHIPRSRKQNWHFSAGSVDDVKENQAPDLFEAMTALTFAAGLTKRIKLCPTGIVLPLRDPLLLAKQSATLHVLSGGRFILGLAIGASRDEFEILGVPFRERGKRTDEYLEVIRRVFDEAPFASADGPNVKFSNAEFFPKPANLPIWICGKVEASMRRVARYGHCFLPAGFSVDLYREKLKLLHEVLDREGRPRAEILCGLETFITVREEEGAADRDATSTLTHWYGGLEKGKESNFIGTPEGISERIARYVELGVRHFELKFITRGLADQLEMMRLIAAEIAPKFA